MSKIEIKAWTTWGSVRGLGPVRETRRQAESDLSGDARGCHQQRGYTDRQLYAVDVDGYVVDPETGANVYPYGPSCGALKVDHV